MKHIQSTTRPLPAKADCGFSWFTADKSLTDGACLFGGSSILAHQLKQLFMTFR